MSSAFVILDSSALIAQINVKDLWHKKAKTISEFIERTDRKVILPAEVLAETLNRIGNNIGRQDAVLAGNALLERNETGDILITTATRKSFATLNLLNSVRNPRTNERPLLTVSSWQPPPSMTPVRFLALMRSLGGMASNYLVTKRNKRHSLQSNRTSS